MVAERPINIIQKFSDTYLRIQEAGSQIHWYEKRDEASSLKIDLVKRFHGRDLYSAAQSVILLIDYIGMPAIEDIFPNDKDRHSWLSGMSVEFREVYSFNRLRGGNIGLARVAIGDSAQLFENIGEHTNALICEDLLEYTRKNLRAENSNKISVSYADLLAESSLKVLKLLES